MQKHAMLKQTRKILIAGISFFPSSDEQDPHTLSEQELQKRLKEYEAAFPTSGWERVKYALFSTDQYGDRSPHFTTIFNFTVSAGVAGVFYGGYKKSQVTYLDFMRTNQATAFLTHTDAKKVLQDKIFVSFIKGGVQLGWRTGLFTFLFTTISNAIALYRNKNGILEYSVGGAVAASTYRVHVGVRAMVVGGVLGLTFGTMAGMFSQGMYYLTGYSMADVRNTHYAFVAYRQSVDQRIYDLAMRENSDEHSEMLERTERDERAGRIEDNLEQIEVVHKMDNKAETKAVVENKSKSQVETKEENKLEAKR